ncbi:prepilin-type cleavage/methylation domain-containing protein [Campylobacter sp. MIT 12-5580]|uniref:prepilin-type N-terminal cleavage/methylation domain-containing protein n=1 Tax=Campylobacter sp. MIT 12-5580 TaxID=2040651 RepID=UPI0010F8FF8B|nr:prepilin-type N-terminal cleavage/methylation domain-containing protein [Campylobacter sp. MIT 12-5580]TKX30170.1 prepilin-type cleavage/methylation domain-containing protein [Campylobacter sp. MIT 12-5580]
MKKAFSVLELIFVIIILGILAAIALPRLSSSKDEAEISKAISNLKTLVSDFSSYALKNDALASTHLMSNVSNIENVDLSNFNGTRIVNFSVAGANDCIELVFINSSHTLIFGFASNANIKTLITNLAAAENSLKANPNDTNAKNAYTTAQNALLNADFTSQSQSKACVALSTQNAFKSLASKTYTLLGN